MSGSRRSGTASTGAQASGRTVVAVAVVVGSSKVVKCGVKGVLKGSW